MKCEIWNANTELFHSLLYNDPLAYLALCMARAWFYSITYWSFPLNTDTFPYSISKTKLVNISTDLIRKSILSTGQLSSSQCGYNFSKILIFTWEFSHWKHILCYFPRCKRLISFSFIAKCPNLNNHSCLSFVLSSRNSFPWNNQLEELTTQITPVLLLEVITVLCLVSSISVMCASHFITQNMKKICI